jgi:glycosyltransferase involved in cell wall biosynthesis
VFASTPDLLLDLPGATWLPLAVDVERWAAPARPPQSRPRVLHVPTSGMKGSDVIDPVLREMDAKGYLEYVHPTGMRHADMPGQMASVDVVVDQIRSGVYGVTAVEAMVSGALVMGHVSDAVRALLPADPGIVEAAPEDFAAAMQRTLDARSEWPELVARSHDFAHRWHDGTESVRALSPFLSER